MIEGETKHQTRVYPGLFSVGTELCAEGLRVGFETWSVVTALGPGVVALLLSFVPYEMVLIRIVTSALNILQGRQIKDLSSSTHRQG